MQRLDFDELESIPSAYLQTSMIRDGREREKKYEDIFSQVFFFGEELPRANKDLDVEYVQKGWKVFNSVGSTWNTKHEHKTEACGLILHSLLAKDSIKVTLKDKIKKIIKDGCIRGNRR